MEPNQLRELMKKTNLTAVTLPKVMAEAMGHRVTRQAVQKWLTGKNKKGIPGYVGYFFKTHYGLHW